MEKKIEVACECPKSDITSMTEAFFCFKPGTLFGSAMARAGPMHQNPRPLTLDLPNSRIRAGETAEAKAAGST
jgi:hypothetical protein